MSFRDEIGTPEADRDLVWLDGEKKRAGNPAPRRGFAEKALNEPVSEAKGRNGWYSIVDLGVERYPRWTFNAVAQGAVTTAEVVNINFYNQQLLANPGCQVNLTLADAEKLWEKLGRALGK